MHHVRTATVPIAAPGREVFEYLADPRTHPEWATEFISHLEESNGELVAVTRMGEARYGVEADARTGVIDIVVTPADRPTVRFPTRVVQLAPEVSAYLFTLAQPTGMPDEEFERGYASLERELENLGRRFGG